MEETKQFSIGFGALTPSIAKQLKEQGYKYDSEEVKHFEKLKESITYLMFSDILNDASIRKAQQKLFTKIRQHVMKKNKLKAIKPTPNVKK